jgi:putative DNA primase/helicase
MTTAAGIAERYALTPSGDSFTGKCPSCGYRGFSVTQRDGRPLFYCHGGGCSPGEIISALREADLWGDLSPDGHLELQGKHRTRPDKPASRSDHCGAAMAIWQRSWPAEGTIVETYLRARGYCDAIPPTLRYVTGKHPSDGEMHPIMVAAASRAGSPAQIVGVHRTFLLADGSGKAALDPNKMSLGNIRGAAVRLAMPASKVAVSEGIETGLSFMQATGIPTWAALSAGGLQALRLPPEVREVVIASDADRVGRDAAHVAARRWHDEGRIVRIVEPPENMDFNDLARAS